MSSLKYKIRCIFLNVIISLRKINKITLNYRFYNKSEKERSGTKSHFARYLLNFLHLKTNVYISVCLCCRSVKEISIHLHNDEEKKFKKKRKLPAFFQDLIIGESTLKGFRIREIN